VNGRVESSDVVRAHLLTRHWLGSDGCASNWTDVSLLSCTSYSSDTSIDALYISNKGPGSSVGIAISYGLDGPGYDSR
jgi:hypothetical protein